MAMTERQRAMSVENPRQEKLRQAFDGAQAIVCGEQAAAIARLLNDGSQSDGTKADPIPGVVAVVGLAKRFEEPDGVLLKDFLTGEPVMDGEVPPMQMRRAELRTVQTLALLADDGRTWSVTPSGSVWPGGASVRETRRGR